MQGTGAGRGERIRKRKIIREKKKEVSQGNIESVTNKNEERKAYM